MKRRGFLKTVAGTFLLSLHGAAPMLSAKTGLDSAAAGTQGDHPNVLFISIEDISPHRLGTYGNEMCKTPHIGRVAAQGLRFDLAHCSAAPCCPSRASMLSGLRPETTGVFSNKDNWAKKLPPGSTIPEHFRAHGYEAIRVGKIFHRGTRRNGKRIIFDDSDRWNRVIPPHKGIPGRTHKRRPLRGQTDVARKNKELQAQGKPRLGFPFLYGPSGLDPIEHTDAKIAEQAVRLLSKHHEKPLFLALGFHSPHLPFTAPDKYFQMYPPEKIELPDNPPDDLEDAPVGIHKDHRRTFHDEQKWREAIAAHYATATFVDDQIGRVLDALEKSGAADNTVVVVWSDHGFQLGEHFRWRKGDLFDHSAMVVLLMKAPGITTPGTVCRRPTESIDIFPTLCDVCGIPIPDGLEGISMTPLLRNPALPWKKGALTCKGPRAKSIRTEHWRYNEYEGKPDEAELYDHITDPGEYKNLAGDPQYASIRAHLSKLINAGWKACLPDTDAPEYPLYAIASGMGHFEPEREDLELLARRFGLVQGNFTREEVEILHEINPDFKVLCYINSSYTTSPHQVPLVEKKYRRALAMFPAARLAEGIGRHDSEFLLKPAPENQNRSIPLKGSTVNGPVSSGSGRRPSTKHYVTWIRIDDELMRVEQFDQESRRVSVTRGFDGSRPTEHSPESLVFSPVYLGSVNDAGAWPGGPGSKLRYAFDPGKPEAGEWIADLAVDTMKKGYDGVWLDILSGSPFNQADALGRKVKPWSFSQGRRYKPEEYRRGQEIKVNAIQEAIRRRVGRTPMLVANSMHARQFEPGKGGLKFLLMPTDVKPRPLDGYSIENFAGHFRPKTGCPDRQMKRSPELLYNSEEHWRSNVQLVMKCAQQSLAAYPMVANAGCKSRFLEWWGQRRDEFEMFAYASYLMAVEKGPPTRLGLPVFCQRADRRFARLHPCYTWPIGAPAETASPDRIDDYRVESHRSYRRRFENGIAIVNPSEKDDGKIELGRTYVDPRNGKKTGSIHMAAHTGRILLHQSDIRKNIRQPSD